MRAQIGSLPTEPAAACQDVAMEDWRDGQTDCDWCYRPLSPHSIAESERFGLGSEHSWACDACLTTTAHQRPPGGWGRPVRGHSKSEGSLNCDVRTAIVA